MAAAAGKNAEPPEPGRRDLAELSALADGTLDATRRTAAQARVAGSVELSELYERERRAVDLVHGRLATTVYYESRGRRIAYTVLAAPALRQPPAVVSHLDGTELRTLRLDARLVVTWRRAGHTCVLSSAGVPARELHKLAAWTPAGT
jgi:hypothetical protein